MNDYIITGIVLVVLVILSGFFSASETAYTSANKIRLRSRADEGSKSAARALKIIERYDKTLTTILVGNNIVNIFTSSLATVLCIELFASAGAAVSTIATTIIVLIFGEIIPKTISKAHAESFACAISGIMLFLMTVLTPVTVIFLLLQKFANKLFCSNEKEVSMTEKELMHIIEEIEDEGVLEEQESDLVRSALVFDEKLVREVITPRVNIAAVDINSDIEKVRDIFLTEGYSRIPVYEKTIDHIIGFVKHKDFFEKLVRGGEFYLRDIVQETIHVAGLMKISDVLMKMQRGKVHLAVVVDQYGGTEGIVTMEDIIEELVGEIWDENDEVKSPVSFRNNKVFVTDGEVACSDFNRYFAGRFHISSESTTLGGWIFELFGRIPKEGESVSTENFKITVKSMKEFRIGALRFEIINEEKTEQ